MKTSFQDSLHPTSSPTFFLYANTPVLRWGDSYFSQYRNFIDFLSALASRNKNFRLSVPCRSEKCGVSLAELIAIELPPGTQELCYYRSMKSAPVASFLNAVRLRKEVRSCMRHSRVTIAGPGPNSFLFWMSFLVPRNVRFAFFIRGDTLKTVQSIYQGSLLNVGATSLVKLFKARIRQLLREKRAIVFVFGDQLGAEYRFANRSVFSIYPLLDDSFVRTDARPGIPNNGPLKVLFVGRLSKEKNVFNLIKACSVANSESRPFKLSIVGSGSLDGVLRKQIQSAGIGHWVSLLGHVAQSQQLLKIYDKHHLLCLPSRTEGTPRVVVEAFARGMPVLATRVGSLPDLFPSNVKFIEDYSATSILETMMWADNNRAVVSAMGLAGQKKIRRFLINENVSIVDKILRRGES